MNWKLLTLGVAFAALTVLASGAVAAEDVTPHDGVSADDYNVTIVDADGTTDTETNISVEVTDEPVPRETNVSVGDTRASVTVYDGVVDADEEDEFVETILANDEVWTAFADHDELDVLVSQEEQLTDGRLESVDGVARVALFPADGSFPRVTVTVDTATDDVSVESVVEQPRNVTDAHERDSDDASVKIVDTAGDETDETIVVERVEDGDSSVAVADERTVTSDRPIESVIPAVGLSVDRLFSFP